MYKTASRFRGRPTINFGRQPRGGSVFSGIPAKAAEKMLSGVNHQPSEEDQEIAVHTDLDGGKFAVPAIDNT